MCLHYCKQKHGAFVSQKRHVFDMFLLSYTKKGAWFDVKTGGLLRNIGATAG